MPPTYNPAHGNMADILGATIHSTTGLSCTTHSRARVWVLMTLCTPADYTMASPKPPLPCRGSEGGAALLPEG